MNLPGHFLKTTDPSWALSQIQLLKLPGSPPHASSPPNQLSRYLFISWIKNFQNQILNIRRAYLHVLIVGTALFILNRIALCIKWTFIKVPTSYELHNSVVGVNYLTLIEDRTQDLT